MIDLHIHSKHSDGTDSTVEILKKADQLGLEIISITDHDRIDAHIELENINVSEYYKGIVIKGAELKSAYKAVPIEILCYARNITKIKKAILDKMKSGEEIQKEHLEHLKTIARAIGLQFEENIEINKKNIYASVTFARSIRKFESNDTLIKKYDMGEDETLFYRNCQSNPNSIFYIDETKYAIPPKDIIEAIHEVGGLAFLAHPLLYPYEDKYETIEEFAKECKIDGLECYYSLFSDEETKKLVEICDKYNLYKSGGSDYHGLNKPDIDMGIGKGNLNIQIEVVKDWIEKVI